VTCLVLVTQNIDLWFLPWAKNELELHVYAIVKAGGHQEKVAVGDTVTVDRIDAAVGATVSFPAVLLVDGASVTSDPKLLSGVKVTGEVLEETKGPKIDILRYKNKTGHRRRQGFRAKQTLVKITAINGAK